MGDYIDRWRRQNGGHVKLDVLEPKNGSYRGTADAVYQNLGYLHKHNIETVIVLAGDHIYKLDYRKMLAFHQMVGADVTVAVTPVFMKQARNFGTVRLGAENRITDFIEKSPVARSNLASMGIYVFNLKFLEERLIADAGDALSRHDFGYSLLPGMVKNDRAFAYKFDGYWQDIGTIQSYYDANMELIRERPGFSLDGASPVLTAERHLAASCIGRGSSIVNSLVSPGCVVKGRIRNSILSPQVWVDEGAVVRNSVIMGNTYIGRGSVVDGCILDEGVHIGEYCRLGLGEGAVAAFRDITVLGKGVVIPSHTVTVYPRQTMPVSVPDLAPSLAMTVEVASGRAMPPLPAREVSGVEV